MIYDCFIFFNEVEVLDIRLHELDSIVDKFVLVEAKETHRGQSKPLYFDERKEDFKQYADKIIHVVVDTLDPTRSTIGGSIHWARENSQRDCIMQGLTDCKDDDIILISDVDEIPRSEVIKNMPFSSQVPFFTNVQRMYYYYLNTYFDNSSWGGTVVVSYKNLKEHSPQHYRNNKKHGIRLRSRIIKEPIGDSGGWHFSYLGGIEKIQQKIRSFAHSELDNDKYNTVKHLQACVNDLRGFHHRGRTHKTIMKLCPMSYLPQYVQENQVRFKEFFYEYPSG